MTMGERLKRRREELGLSQQDLADATGISRQTVAQIESGARKAMSTDTAKALARALGVSIDYLVGTWEAPEGQPEPAALAAVGA